MLLMRRLVVCEWVIYNIMRECSMSESKNQNHLVFHIVIVLCVICCKLKKIKKIETEDIILTKQEVTWVSGYANKICYLTILIILGFRTTNCFSYRRMSFLKYPVIFHEVWMTQHNILVNFKLTSRVSNISTWYLILALLDLMSCV